MFLQMMTELMNLIMKDNGYRRKTPQFESSPNQKNDKVGARNMKEVTHFECKE